MILDALFRMNLERKCDYFVSGHQYQFNVLHLKVFNAYINIH